MTMTQVEYPTAPAVTPVRGTLLDAATVEDKFRWLEGDGLFQSYNCLRFDAEAAFCAPNTKDLTQTGGWTDGFRFAAYGGVTCKAIGLDQAEMGAGVARAFEVGESVAVERALMKYRFAAQDGTTDGFPGVWDAPEDITPTGGAVTPKVGIALLEEYAGSVYVGAPTLHIPRAIASLVLVMDGASFEGNSLRTKFGSKVAAGGGYSSPNLGPDGTEADEGERWVYATGEVWVGAGERNVIGPVMDLAGAVNDVVVLAERPYVVAVDCFAVAIRVTVE